MAIIFDNLDRRGLDLQDEAYLRASAISRDWAALVFVCLRPNTYYHSRHFSVLDSVAPKLIHINSPDTGLALVRRLRFAKRYAEGESVELPADRAPLGSTYSFELPSVANFLECLGESFRKNAKLTALFDAISNGNTRDLITYALLFLTSAHLNTKEILEKYAEDRKYHVPEHHALRAMLYREFVHYDPSSSLFINLFDIPRADPAEHFTRFLALHYLTTVPLGPPTFGFCPVEEVVNYLSQIGYSEQHVLGTLRYLFERKCIESRDPIEAWDDGIKVVRVTMLGKYHVGILASRFEYLDAISVDTPILDSKIRADIKDVFRVEQRLDRVRLLLTYLNECNQHVPDAPCRNLWESAADAVWRQMETIQASVDKRLRQNGT